MTYLSANIGPVKQHMPRMNLARNLRRQGGIPLCMFASTFCLEKGAIWHKRENSAQLRLD